MDQIDDLNSDEYESLNIEDIRTNGQIAPPFVPKLVALIKISISLTFSSIVSQSMISIKLKDFFNSKALLFVLLAR